MTLSKLSIAPGISPGATPEDAAGGWWDLNWVRFLGPTLTPIGGWTALPGVQLTDGDGNPESVRALISWRDNARSRWIGMGSWSKIQIFDDQPHDITPADYTPGTGEFALDGYGIGYYQDGEQAYGMPAVDLGVVDKTLPLPDTLVFDNFGEMLLAMGSKDGRLLQWVPSIDAPTLEDPANKMYPVPGAPSGRVFGVTEQRHVVIVGGGGDPRSVVWCSQEDIEDWVDTITNTAGGDTLRTDGSGIAMHRVREGMLIWCDDDIHLLTYVGPPYVYGLQRVGDSCGPIGPDAIATSGGRAWWMGREGFWMWDGQARLIPTPLDNDIFQNVNTNTGARACAAYSGTFPEAWFWWPDVSSIENNRYAALDVDRTRWISGDMQVTAAANRGPSGSPLTGDQNGFVYEMEQADQSANGTPRGALVFAETGNIEIADGDAGVMIRALLADINNIGAVQFHVFGQWEPNGPIDDLGVFPIERVDGVVDMLVEARSIRLRIEGVADQPWTLGQMRVDIVPGSQL